MSYSDKHTPAQQRLYRSLVKSLAMDDETRRLVTQRVCRRRSTRNLTRGEMARLVNELLRLAGRKAEVRRQRTAGGASVGQAMKIRALAEVLGWADNPDRLAGFLRRMSVWRLHVDAGGERRVAGSIGDAVDRPELLTASQAVKVIEALKSMVEVRTTKHAKGAKT